jgi:hypothetical protein
MIASIQELKKRDDDLEIKTRPSAATSTPTNPRTPDRRAPRPSAGAIVNRPNPFLPKLHSANATIPPPPAHARPARQPNRATRCPASLFRPRSREIRDTPPFQYP